MTPKEFLKDFVPAYEQGNTKILHEIRRKVFEETVQIAKMGRYITENGDVISLPNPLEMMNKTYLYQSIECTEKSELNQKTIVEVCDSDSLLAGKKLLDEGYTPAVLNFANRQTPGGGVLRGSGAQEENIFRRSNLFMSLYQFHDHGIGFNIPQRSERYPMDRSTGGAYSPDVTVFRGLETDGYPLLQNPYALSIITVAAINRPELKNQYQITDHLVEPTKEKMRTIFRIALKHNHDAIVLGAWGCGAFKNPPQHVAKLFHQVMEEEEFRNKFKKIVFAIIDREKLEIDSSKDGNILPFQEEFTTLATTTSIVEKQENQMELFNRFKGIFWGLVVGDCLGSPIQFTDKDSHPYITEMKPCKIFNVPAGYWTDDSSMAFCVAESIVRLKKYDLEDIGNNFIRWRENGFWSSKDYAFDVGIATDSAIYGIRHGHLKNGREDSQGNGSIMRLAPSYIWNYGTYDDKILHEISDLTHNSSKVRDTISLMARICDDHMVGKRTVVKSLYAKRSDVNNSGWAVSTLQAALWAFETTSTFEDGMIAAVNLGGDADSIGAVYGQIAGAYYGFDGIPSRWVNAVKDQQEINDLIEKFIRLKIPHKKRETVIIAGAHPDDLVGSAGLALLLKDKFELHVMDFTKGELGLGMAGLQDGSTAAKRVIEEGNACAMLGATPHFMGEIDGFAYANKEVTERIANLFKELQPRAIITHWPIDRHLDHVMCTASVLKAVSLAGLTSQTEIYFFEETCQSMNFQPRFYVDITSVKEQKDALIRQYACQNVNDGIVQNKTHDAVFRGSQIVVKYAEAYAALRGELPGKSTIFSELPQSQSAG